MMYLLSDVRTWKGEQCGTPRPAPMFALLHLDETTRATLTALRDHVEKAVKKFGSFTKIEVGLPECTVGLYHDPLFAVTNAHFAQYMGKGTPCVFTEGATVEELVGVSADDLAQHAVEVGDNDDFHIEAWCDGFRFEYQIECQGDARICSTVFMWDVLDQD